MKKFIFLSLIILFLNKTQNVSADQNTFIVDNIIVTGEIRDNNYRENYTSVAFRKGFQKLIENILQIKDQKKILSTDLSTIKSLAANYKIVEEKVLENKYNANITITFKRNLVSDFFYKKGISYSESEKLQTIVYPILILNSELQVFSNNKFFDEWNTDEDFSNIDFVLPVENLDDISFIKKNLPVLEEIDLSQLVDNYEIKNSAILILRYDEKVLNIFLKTNFKNVKKLKKIELNVKNLQDKKVRESVIVSLKSSIHDLWKEQNLIDISVPSYLTINAPIKEPNSLGEIIKRLKTISLITDYYIDELANDSVKIRIKYLGKIKNLQDSFTDNGFIFKILNNEWELTLAG
tara:strand:+ start:2619 stop:3668 length:1050 start_codon:yes stop_codon:yes gene_type:complete